MTINIDRKKLIDKVTKLMALADGTNHGPEAESARRMAAELMARHNLTYSDLDSKEVPFATRDESTGRQSLAAYETHLLAALAAFNGVCLLKHNGKDYRFIGRQPDLEAFDYMRDIVNQQRQASFRSYYLEHYGKHPGAAIRARYFNGFAIGVTRKLAELRDQMNSKVQEWGLVPVDPSMQALAWYKEHAKVRDARQGRGLSCNKAGIEAGKNVSLNKGVTQTGTETLKIGR